MSNSANTTMKEDIQATWSNADKTPRVDEPRHKAKPEAKGAVSNRPRVKIRYKRKKAN